MFRIVIGGFAALVGVAAAAAGPGLKPGLWETRILNGPGSAAAPAAPAGVLTSDQLEQALKRMPPEQRARAEAAMKFHGAANAGAARICITPEQARQNMPMVDRDGHCAPSSIVHNGNHTTFEFSCTIGGVTSSGKGDSTMTEDLVTTRTDVTVRTADGTTRTVHSEIEQKYLGADCGDVKPIVPPLKMR